ncbi:hypothetical protein ACFYTQ_26520 [Nocardia sp. NPDC004068]|uniref:hypothetical protein n=1 Tax=Nocardia sp. NPDC004068 TaxID=3364303 RepID=UPI0036D15FEB
MRRGVGTVVASGLVALCIGSGAASAGATGIELQPDAPVAAVPGSSGSGTALLSDLIAGISSCGNAPPAPGIC